MSTAERAVAIAAAAAPFSDLLGPISASDLLDLVRWELGHEGMLDDFYPRGQRGHYARASASSPILHVISGNTPHAGLQSLIRGLLVGAHNLCKLPSGTDQSALSDFTRQLPHALALRVELTEDLPEKWLQAAATVIVFGSDETIAALHRNVRPDQAFLPHGHRVSLAVIFDDPAGQSWPEVARAVSLFDQMGCLSPQVIYVRGDSRGYAEGLADAMDQYNRHSPRRTLTVAEASSIRALRDDWSFRVANAPADHALWHSAGSTAWTVLFDGKDSRFTPSPLNRVVTVKPWPADPRAALATVRPYLSTIGCWPGQRVDLEQLVSLDFGASRYCPVAAMQLPPLTWHQDGMPPLSALVRWTDLELA